MTTKKSRSISKATKMNVFIKLHTTLLLLVSCLTLLCRADSVPEDLLTDNEEQLAKLKRENLIDSILNQLSFLGTSKKTEERDDVLKKDPGNKFVSQTVPLMSVFPSPSSFHSAQIQSIKISLSSNITHTSISTSVFSNDTNALNATAHSSIVVNISSSISKNISASRNVSTRAATLLKSINSSSMSKATHNSSFIGPLFTSMYLSTTPISISSSPAPHSTRAVLDTAQMTATPSSTIFANKEKSSVPPIMETKAIVPEQSSTTARTDESSVHGSVAYSSREMPALPDESGYGDYVPTAIKNEKGIGFVYVNVLLPIVSGIVGALLISFAVLLFRCCRRRRLKKVRYFGGKPSRDFVQLDRMNLLTDTSDEDDFD